MSPSEQQEVLVPEVVKPDITEELQALTFIQAGPIIVTDRASNDLTATNVIAAENLLQAVENKFGPSLKKIRDGLAGINSVLDEVRGPCRQIAKEGRASCAKWLGAEQDRADAERRAALEAYQKKLDEHTPMDEPIPVPELAITTVQSGGFASRNKPWDIEEIDRKQLETATVSDPRLWAYWEPSMAALKAAAKSQKEKFNIPGFRAVRGKTVSRKG